MKRVLFISYTFPPVGGAGVQRIAKFAKYLPACQWAVSVLTAANPSVPLFDETLCTDIPVDTVIQRATTWEPSYRLKSTIVRSERSKLHPSLGSRTKSFARTLANLLLQPDPQILWAPSAISTGKQLLSRLPHDVIVASGPPFSAFLIGARLSRRFNIPLVLDYRDEWDISRTHWENRSCKGFVEGTQTWLQARTLRAANQVIATTKLSALQLATRVAQAGATARVEHVYNGYDPDDFPPLSSPRPRRRKFRITYAGTLWKLTSIEPLVTAAEYISATQPEMAKRLEFVVVGRCTGEQEVVLNRLLATHVQLNRQSYLPHAETVQLMRDSDMLCVLLADTHDAARVVPAKIFEYLACKRPVLAIAPPGEMCELLKDNPIAVCHAPGDIQAIAATLAMAIQSPQRLTPSIDDWDVTMHSRLGQAQQLAAILDETAGFGPTSHSRPDGQLRKLASVCD